METYMTPYVIAWLVLATAVVALAVTRKVVAHYEDDLLHVREGDAALNTQQQATANKLEVIDRWGKILTAAAVVSGIVMAVWFLYQAIESNKLPVM